MSELAKNNRLGRSPRHVWSVAGCLAVVAVAAGLAGLRPQRSEPAGEPKVRAVTLDAVNRPTPASVTELRDIGVSHIAVVPFAFQHSPDDPNLRFRADARWYTESEQGIRELARQGDSLHLQLIIKPHVWIRGNNSAGLTRADIGFDNEEDWQSWEAAYSRFILHYASLAASVNADILVVGTELRRPATEREKYWRELIADARAVFSGKITYAANWYGEYDHIPFWDALDYIGVQAYFPVVRDDETDLSPDRLRNGWTRHREALRKHSRKFQRPLLFTEIGYRSVGYAAAEPWRWAGRNEMSEPDLELQAHLYEAFFASLWREPWFGGAIVWKWPAEHSKRHDIDFSPRGKPAEQVLRKWFTVLETQ